MIRNSCLAILLAALTAAGGLAPQANAQTAAVLIVERTDAPGQALGRLLEAKLKGRVELRWLTYSESQLADPISKGRLLASLTAAKLVVPIGDLPTRLALSELEETPIYFVGASIVQGDGLSNAHVSGLLSYSAEDVLAAIPHAWKRKAGLLYSPGYEEVVAIIQAAAKNYGVELIARRVGKLQELPAAAQALMASVRVIWALGDPLFSQGAGFDYLTELSLSHDVAFVGAGPEEVRGGAVLCSQASNEALAQQAQPRIVQLMSGGEAQRVTTSAGQGRIVFNRPLATRYRLIPQPSWIEAR